MATRKPLVVIDGAVRELPAGDTTIEEPITTVLDEHYNSVSLLLHGEGAAFTDDGPAHLAVSAVGNAQVSTAQSKFGSASMKFDGSGDYLSVPIAGGGFTLGTGDFTVEMWVYPQASAAQALMCFGSGSTTQPYFYLNGLTPTLFWNNTNVVSGPALTLNVWNYVTLTRSGTTFRVFKGGVVGTAANGFADSFSCTLLRIGASDTAAQGLTGYIDDLRVTKGVARYTANFTPPDAAHPDAYSITTGGSTQTDLLLPYLTAGIRDSTTATGTGSLALANAPLTGYKSFSMALVEGAVTDYCIQGTTSEWEVGTGVYSSSQLTRTTVKSSSNNNALVNFSAGTKQVFALPHADNIRQAALGRQYAYSRGFALP